VHDKSSATASSVAGIRSDTEVSAAIAENGDSSELAALKNNVAGVWDTEGNAGEKETGEAETVKTVAWDSSAGTTTSFIWAVILDADAGLSILGSGTGK
jgi:hypothetical protein